MHVHWVGWITDFNTTCQNDGCGRYSCYYASFAVGTTVSLETAPASVLDMASRIEVNIETYRYFVSESAGVILGYAYGSQYRPRPAYQSSAEVSVYIAPLGQGRGLGQAPYKALIKNLTDLGFHPLIGIVTSQNPASARLHKACRFELVGTLHDVDKKFSHWHGTLFINL